MPRNVHIPDNVRPNWVCSINNIIYSYEADTWMTVPDEVADLCDAYWNEVYKENKPTPGLYMHQVGLVTTYDDNEEIVLLRVLSPEEKPFESLQWMCEHEDEYLILDGIYDDGDPDAGGVQGMVFRAYPSTLIDGDDECYGVVLQGYYRGEEDGDGNSLLYALWKTVKDDGEHDFSFTDDLYFIC